MINVMQIFNKNFNLVNSAPQNNNWKKKKKKI